MAAFPIGGERELPLKDPKVKKQIPKKEDFNKTKKNYSILMNVIPRPPTVFGSDRSAYVSGVSGAVATTLIWYPPGGNFVTSSCACWDERPGVTPVISAN